MLRRWSDMYPDGPQHVTDTGCHDVGGLGSLERPATVTGSEALDATALRALLDQLATCLLEGTRLAKRVMLLTELGDAAERRANATVDAASGDPGDETAIERAVAASAALSDVNEQEAQASGRWALHTEQAADLARQAQRATLALETAEEAWSRPQHEQNTTRAGAPPPAH